MKLKPEGIAISKYRRYIETALQHSGGTHSYEDVVRLVREKKLQFWAGPSSCVITELIDFPQKRVAFVFLAGGNLGEIERMGPALCEWAKQQGCVGVHFAGRPGWERTFLTRTGWTKSAVLFEKVL